MSHLLKKKDMEKDAKSQDPSLINTEATIALLQSELHQAQSSALESQRDLKHLHSQYQALADKELNARKYAQYWRTKHDAKATDLTEAKNALFDLQASEQIPDSRIADQWSKLCRAIEQWVDDHTQQDPKRPHQQLKRFFDSGRVRAAMGDRTPDYWDVAKSEATLAYTDRFEYLVRLSIHSLLGKFVFDRSLTMIGIRSEDSDLIAHIAKLLATLTPRRDDASIAQWRSEALKALCSTPEYAKKKRSAVDDIVLEGKDFLSSLVIADPDRAFANFERDVVEAAVDFDLTIRQSTSSYYFVFEPLSKKTPSQGNHQLAQQQTTPPLLFLSCFEMAAVIDIETGRRFTSKNVVEAEGQGPLGQRALLIYPALCCRRGKSELLLGKQLILAEVLNVPRLKAKEKVGSGNKGL